MSNYLGIDIGSSGCKAVLFDGDGRPLKSATREYEVHLTGDGGAELDSDEVIEKCLAVIREVGPARAMGISSQGEAFTAIRADGRALCRAMISSDVRSDRYARTWPQQFGEQRLYEITGHTAHPMFTLFKLLWLKETKPDVWRNAAKFLCFEDLLAYRLGLEPAMGWPLAGRTMLFDVRRHEWSAAILDAIGLPAEKLARPLPAGSVIGQVGEMLVVTGGHDQPCGALGAGATEPGVAMYATGTVECITPAFEKPVFTEALRKNNLCTYDHTAPGRYTTVAFSLTGGNILKWYRDQFGGEYESLLKSLPAKPTDLLVLPYWTPSGTPHFDTQTPGAILGLRLATTRGEILRALLEGVALEMRLNLEILEESGCAIRELRAIGGGAKSPVWTQLKADVTGRRITTLNVTEAGCLGVALLACAADTGRSVTELARQWVKPVGEFKPREDYSRQFARYRQLQPALSRI